MLAEALRKLGFTITHEEYFDTIRVELGSRSSLDIQAAAVEKRINLRAISDDAVCIALDERTNSVTSSIE